MYTLVGAYSPRCRTKVNSRNENISVVPFVIREPNSRSWLCSGSPWLIVIWLGRRWGRLVIMAGCLVPASLSLVNFCFSFA